MTAVTVRPPRPEDLDEFLAAVHASREFHHPWVNPPQDAPAFRRYLRAVESGRFLPRLICDGDSGAIAGVVNASEIVRGNFQSAYLGYYAFAASAGRGIMTAGLHRVLRELFVGESLHRVEANIQPGNERSRALVMRLGFRMEGFSPRYLKIGGRWCDHERWALLAEEWKNHRAKERRNAT